MMAGQNTRVNSLSGPTNNGADARFLTSREPTAGKFLDNACHNRCDRCAHSWWNFTVRQPFNGGTHGCAKDFGAVTHESIWRAFSHFPRCVPAPFIDANLRRL